MISNLSAANAYHNARTSIAPAEELPQGLSKGIADFAQVMGQVDADAMGAMSGRTETHELVQSIARAEMAMDMVTAIRDKVVEAYQEIMRMPV